MVDDGNTPEIPGHEVIGPSNSIRVTSPKMRREKVKTLGYSKRSRFLLDLRTEEKKYW